MTERTWALTKLGPGDYVLPSDDALTDDGARPTGRGSLFRFTRWEDGPHLGVDRVATRWRLRSTPYAPCHGAFLLDLDDDELIRWEDLADFPTRREAIDYAIGFAQHEPQEADTP